MATLVDFPQVAATFVSTALNSAWPTPKEELADYSPLFLGLDLSTQQLKAILATDKGNVVHETAVNFDRDLPRFGTKGGAIQGLRAGEVTSPVALWVAAIDLLLERMKNENVEIHRIMGISGAGQVSYCGRTFLFFSRMLNIITAALATWLSLLVA